MEQHAQGGRLRWRGQASAAVEPFQLSHAGYVGGPHGTGGVPGQQRAGHAGHLCVSRPYNQGEMGSDTELGHGYVVPPLIMWHLVWRVN